MKASVKKINLLPKEYIQERKALYIQLGVIAVVALEVVGFIGGVVLPPKIESRQVMARLEEVTAELSDSRFANVNQKIQDLEDMKVEVEDWNKKYEDIKDENFVSKRVIDSLLTRVPVGLTVSNMSILKEDESKQISLEGNSDDAADVLNYATIIEGVFGLGTTRYDFELDKETGMYDYTIDIQIANSEEEVEPVVEESTETTDSTTDSTTDNVEGGDNQ